MRYSVVVTKTWVLFFCAAGALLLLTFVHAAPVGAQDTAINVAVCGVGSSAQLTIDTPPSDSVVNTPNVQISGQVANATQIDISIDGQYNSTVPLGATQTSYSTSVQLSSGTHTVSLLANDVCNNQDATASVVITYQPQTTPGSGGDTPTTIDNGGGGNGSGSGGGGVQIGGQPIDGFGADGSGSGNGSGSGGSGDGDRSAQITLENLPVIGPIVGVGLNIAEALDFETSTDGTLWQSTARFSLVVLGISTVVFGNIALSTWVWTNRAIAAPTKWGIRGLGLVLLVAAFII